MDHYLYQNHISKGKLTQANYEFLMECTQVTPEDLQLWPVQSIWILTYTRIINTNI